MRKVERPQEIESGPESEFETMIQRLVSADNDVRQEAAIRAVIETGPVCHDRLFATCSS